MYPAAVPPYGAPAAAGPYGAPPAPGVGAPPPPAYVYPAAPPVNPYNPGLMGAAPYPYGAAAPWPTTYYNTMARNWPGAMNTNQNYYYNAPPAPWANWYNPANAYNNNNFDTNWWANGGRNPVQNTNIYGVNSNNNGPNFAGTVTNNNPNANSNTAQPAAQATTSAAATASTAATSTSTVPTLTRDELTKVVGTIDNDFTKNLLQLLTLLVERDKRLAGNYDQNAIYDIMNNSMNTNNIINNVASLLTTINRADRLLGDNEATADTELRNKITSSRSHIQQVGRQFYDRINQLTNINPVNPFNDRRLSLINSAIGVTDVNRFPMLWDLAYETFFNLYSLLLSNPTTCTLDQDLLSTNAQRTATNRFQGVQIQSTFVGQVESLQDIREKHLNLRPLDLDIAEFVATNIPLETLLSYATAQGRNNHDIDMELANMVQFTQSNNQRLSFTIPRKNMIQRQPKSPDDVLSAHLVEGDVFYRKMAIATLLYNMYNRVQLTTRNGTRVNNFPGTNNTILNPWTHRIRVFSFVEYQNNAFIADVLNPGNQLAVPVMIPAVAGQTYSQNSVVCNITAPVNAGAEAFSANNFKYLNYQPSIETTVVNTATDNASFVLQNVLLLILSQFLNNIIYNPVTRQVNIQRAMYELGYQSENMDELVSELIKENETFNLVPPCATTKYSLEDLRDMARMMGIPRDEIDKTTNKLELCDMIIKADNQAGPMKGRLFARNGTAPGRDNSQVVEVRRRMDSIFRRVFGDWVLNTYVLSNNFNDVTFQDYQRNVNVFDKLISNQRLAETAKTRVINKLKNIRGPGENILTVAKLDFLMHYIEAIRDMDGAVHTEMVIDRIRRP